MHSNELQTGYRGAVSRAGRRRGLVGETVRARARTRWVTWWVRIGGRNKNKYGGYGERDGRRYGERYGERRNGRGAENGGPRKGEEGDDKGAKDRAPNKSRMVEIKTAVERGEPRSKED